jgi:hypothetical protein
MQLQLHVFLHAHCHALAFLPADLIIAAFLFAGDDIFA